jgi:hypothetical protein
LNAAMQLNIQHYQNVMLAAWMRQKKGEQTTISLRNLEFFMASLKKIWQYTLQELLYKTKTTTSFV